MSLVTSQFSYCESLSWGSSADRYPHGNGSWAFLFSFFSTTVPHSWANVQDGASPASTQRHLEGHDCEFDDCTADPNDQSAVLAVISVNDVHDMMPGRDGRRHCERGDTAGREREKAPEDATVIVTLNGDFLNGTEMGQKLENAHSIWLIYQVGVDYVVPANHEADFGEQIHGPSTRRIHGRHDCRLERRLAARVVWHVYTRDAHLVILGDNIAFEDAVATARQCVDKLRGDFHVDFIIVLTHMHVQDDKALAHHVPEIDLILSSHDHEPYAMYEGKTLIHKSDQNAHWLAKLEFELHRSGVHPDRPLSATPQWSMIVNQHIRAEPKCEHIVVKYLRLLSAMDKSVVAKCVLGTVAEYPLSTQTIMLRSG